MTARPTPNMGGQPTGRTPIETAQPIQRTARHGRSAQWAGSAAVVLWAVGGLAHWAGCTAQAYAGAALGGAALGVSIAHLTAHRWAGRRAHRAAHSSPVVWAPMGAAQARATLLRLAHAHRGGGA